MTSTAVEVRTKARVSRELSRYSSTLFDDDGSRIAFRRDDGMSLECIAVHFRNSTVGLLSVRWDLKGAASIAWIAWAR